MADNGIQPKDIVHNADNKFIIHGKLIVVFVPYSISSKNKLSSLGVIMSVFIYDMV